MTMAVIILTSIGLAAIGLFAFRRFVHRGLAPERVRESKSPGDLGLPYEEVAIPTENGKRLFGWLVQVPCAGRAAAVVILHGWGGNSEMMLPLLEPLHEAGFVVLLFDARCHGRSDEDDFASLPRFAEDLQHAVDWLQEQAFVDPHNVALVGHSVGAGAALLVASQRNDIAAVVSLAAFSHPAAMMRRFLSAKGIPYLPLGWIVLRYVQNVIGHRFDDIAPVTSIRQVRCPTLLVHGAGDTAVPAAEACAIHNARTGDHVTLKIIAGSHADFGDRNDIAGEVGDLVSFLLGCRPITPQSCALPDPAAVSPVRRTTAGGA